MTSTKCISETVLCSQNDGRCNVNTESDNKREIYQFDAFASLQDIELVQIDFHSAWFRKLKPSKTDWRYFRARGTPTLFSVEDSIMLSNAFAANTTRAL